MSKTLYIDQANRARLKAQGIDLSDYPNAGPHPSITGMKKIFWGIDALCIKPGSFVYKVPIEVYQAALNIGGY